MRATYNLFAGQSLYRISALTADISAAVERRIIVAQVLYAFGALLCLPASYVGIRGTYVSIAVIVLVQLNYVLAPHIKPLYRL